MNKSNSEQRLILVPVPAPVSVPVPVQPVSLFDYCPAANSLEILALDADSDSIHRDHTKQGASEAWRNVKQFRCQQAIRRIDPGQHNK